ncbi:MAG TPA: zinc ribbon domain-containing protein, partial [Pirellulales bacterium]|nr:zinc ribbon domain-containing protein [Pirellulales bacterium]
MPDILSKCVTCGAVLDEEDLFCPNCGAEAPSRDGGAAPAAHETTHNFVCKGCGASMSYDASAGTLRCPFCGSTELEKRPDAKEIAPERIVPFVVTQEQAIGAMRQWLGSSYWRPGDLSEQAAIVKMTPVYVPYWVFDGQTHTYWTADSSHTPAGARSSWYPITGQHEGTYQGLLVGASGALTPGETAALCPFDLSPAVPPDKIDLNNSIYERFTVPRKYARPLASQGFEQLEAAACRPSVPGSARNLKVNVRITDLTSQPMLVPVWIMAYRYQDRVFRFLANGQTGRVTGQAPLSWRKIAVAIAIVVLVILLFLAFAVSRGRAAPRFSLSLWKRAGVRGSAASREVPLTQPLPEGEEFVSSLIGAGADRVAFPQWFGEWYTSAGQQTFSAGASQVRSGLCANRFCNP